MMPYYTCPFISGSVNTMYIPDAYSPMTMPSYQTCMPPVMPMPMMPMEQTEAQFQLAHGIHMPSSMFTMNNDDDIDYVPGTALSNDPPPVLSDNPPVTNIVLFKELTAYPNYGNPSGNADILYTGTQGTWTFNVPAFLFVPGNLRAQLVIRSVLDDHSNVPVNRYSARITVNGATVLSGPLNLEHGFPAGGRFTNWRQLTFDIRNLRRNNRVVIANTSTAGPNDWIAFDWMELRLFQR